MIQFPHFQFSEEMSGMDCFLLLLIIVVLVMVLTIGPERHCYVESIASMFRYRSSDTEFIYPSGSLFRGIVVFLASCASFGLMLCSIEGDFSLDGGRGLILFAFGSFFAACFYLVKLILYMSVNSRLFRKQIISVKPSRWNGFFNMLFSVSGVMFLVVALIVTFFGIPRLYGMILAFSVPVFIELGVIYKIKSSLFKNKVSGLDFFYYLCALEFSPLALAIPVLMRVMYSI
ncbi:MAG: DUF4271 domain-containing protein [Bacteroidaceae bacterium]|nr:DUF4271 domain-containing protein [Bacteroidaceae bacterium]